MLAVNCRAYQAALILFDAIKRVANRDCVNFSYQPSAPPAHTTVPFYDNVESAPSTPSTSSAVFTPDVSVSNTEEKLTKVMNAWFSKDAPQTATTTMTTTTIPTQTTCTAPVITSLHTQTPTPFAKRSTDIDWLYSYSQQRTSESNPTMQQHFDPSKSK